MTTEKINCPYCNGEASIEYDRLSIAEPPPYYTFCKNECGKKGERDIDQGCYGNTPELSILRWNNRALKHKLEKCLEFIKSLTKLSPIKQEGYETANGVSFVVSKLSQELLKELGEPHVEK